MKKTKLALLPSFFAIALFVGVTQWTMTQSLNAQETAVATEEEE